MGIRDYSDPTASPRHGATEERLRLVVGSVRIGRITTGTLATKSPTKLNAFNDKMARKVPENLAFVEL